MAVHIEELHASVRVVDPQAMLTPAVLDRIVEAVIERMAARAQQSRVRADEQDVRSVVARQRGRGGRDG